MSQQYFPGGGSSAGEGSSKSPPVSDSFDPSPPSNPSPEYMVVGSGAVSENATSLMASLNNDSGYGGSIAGDSMDGFHSALMEDRPTPSSTPRMLPGTR